MGTLPMKPLRFPECVSLLTFFSILFGPVRDTQNKPYH